MRPSRRPASLVFVVAIVAWFGGAAPARGGGPRYVAGSSYFDSAAKGQPVLWAGGTVAYFTDLGALSGSVSNASANATIDAAAATWNGITTAAVAIDRGGTLAEDVNGSNVIASGSGISLPPDVQSTAVTKPVGIIFDADGAVIDALFGAGASDPDDCVDSGVMNIVDNLSPTGTIVHALILINGRCTGTAAQLEQIEFQLIRAFGRVLGLGWSQANDAVLSSSTDPSVQQLEGWPIMRPLDLDCNQLSTQCVPNPLQLRADDAASLSRLYPVTAENSSRFPGKQITTDSTISIRGSVYFRRGQGMQGVNVIARPLTPGVLQPDDRYPVSAVSGFLYTGDEESPITGMLDSSGTALSKFGSDDQMLEGFYDLSGIPLPLGASTADYLITLEPVNSLYTGSMAVGPYALGTPTPSGTLPTITLHGLTAGMALQQDFTVADSAGDLQTATGGTFSTPAALPVAGEWEGRVPDPGQTGWFALPVLGGRHLTVESQALDELDNASESKLRTVIGIWNGSEANESPPINATVAPFNGSSTGVTSLGVDAVADGELLLAIGDQRGDGRPDYSYRGRLLYAATVTPQRLPATGGLIQIAGSGFRPGMTVTLGSNISATVTDISPTRILAAAPPNAVPSGSIDLVVLDPSTNGAAVIAGGISYGAASDDTVSVIVPPPATLSIGAAAPFTVRVFGPDQLTPVGNVPVTFSVLQGTATFANCGGGPCPVMASDDGYATVRVVPGSSGLIRLQASLTTGATVTAEINGVTTLAIVPVNASLFVAAGASVNWTAQVQVVDNGSLLSHVPVTWTGKSNLATQAGTSSTNAQGIASFAFSAGPWAEGTSAPVTACVEGTSSCASFTVFVAHPETESLAGVSGLAQSIEVGANPAPVVVRLLEPSGEPVVGGVVSFWTSTRSWTPPCSRGGTCASGRLLGTAFQTAVSDTNGNASLQPVIFPGIAVVLTGVAEAGTSATMPFRVEIYP